MRVSQLLGIAISVAAILMVGSTAFADDPGASTDASSTSAPASSDHHSGVKFVPSLQVGVSTLGVGLHLAGQITDNVYARVGGNVLSLSNNESESGIDYHANLKLQSIEGLVDLYPGRRSSIHLTLGVMDNTSSVTGNAITTTTSGTQTVTINNNVYDVPAGAKLTAKVDYSGVKPYIGIGFGRPSSRPGGISFYSDFGAVLSDTAKVTLNASGLVPDGSNAAAVLATDVSAQQTKTQSDLNKLSFYPVIMVGFGIAI